jgi:hypothetical protein
MKLLVHASIFSVVFAGFVASALTTKVTPHASAYLRPQHRLRLLEPKSSTNAYSGST